MCYASIKIMKDGFCTVLVVPNQVEGTEYTVCVLGEGKGAYSKIVALGPSWSLNCGIYRT